MKKVIAFLVAAALCFSLVACGAAQNAAGTAEGAGASSAEEAAGAYLAALKKADVAGMISAFAVETYVDNFDFEAQISRLGAYSTALDPNLPATNDFTKDLNLYSRIGSITTNLKYQYLTLFASGMEALDGTVMQLEEGSDISELVALLGDPAYVGLLQKLEVVKYIEPEELSENYATEQNQENIQKNADIWGAEEAASVAVLINIKGTEYLLGFDVARYGNKWYVVSLGGNIGALLGIAVTAGGVMVQ